MLDEALSYVDIPADLLYENNRPINYITQVNKYYSEITMCINSACKTTIPYTARGTSFSDHCVPGWNDVVAVSYTHLTLPTIYSV